MTRRVIKGMATAGLGVLLLAAAGAWYDADAGGRKHRGRHHHHGFHGKHHGFHGKHFRGPRPFIGLRFHVGPRAYPHYAYPPYPYYGGYYRYAPPPVVVTPPPVVVTPPPTSYVERPASDYWHYCREPAGYYPEIQQCPGGWVRVLPRSE
ncbi:MAG: hypothetical protein ACREI6_07225 [Candidatus Rokuibacteriota bacterium]